MADNDELVAAEEPAAEEPAAKPVKMTKPAAAEKPVRRTARAPKPDPDAKITPRAIPVQAAATAPEPAGAVKPLVTTMRPGDEKPAPKTTPKPPPDPDEKIPPLGPILRSTVTEKPKPAATPKPAPTPKPKVTDEQPPQVLVTQIKSKIGQKPTARRTLRALGLTKVGSQATHLDTPNIRGMLHSVVHLVTVEEVK